MLSKSFYGMCDFKRRIKGQEFEEWDYKGAEKGRMM